MHTIPEARQLTRARVRDLGTLLLKYGRRHLPPSTPQAAPPEPPRVTGSHAFALRYLQLVPFLLGALFLLSFFWDFQGLSFTVLGATLQFEGLLRITAVSGLIGFLTNWLAITMLFQPRERRPIFGQGLVPGQRERVIYRLAQAVATELINEEIIKQKIQESGVISKYRELGLHTMRGVLEDVEFREDLRTLVIDYVHRVVQSEEVRTRLAEITIEKLEEHAGKGLSGFALKTYRYFKEDDFQERIEAAIADIPAALDAVLDSSDHFLDQLPARIEARADTIERWVSTTVLNFIGQLDIYGMVLSNMQKYDERRLEQLIKTSTNEQLNYIKYLGGVLGFFGGLVIWAPALALSFFTLLGLTLYALDEVLYRTRPA